MIRVAAQLGPARQKNETATIGGDPRRSRSVDKGWRRLGVGSALIQGQIYGRRSRGLLLSLRATPPAFRIPLRTISVRTIRA